ncbi:MAG TPA: multidrug efflux RND transporter permease subunit [Gemmatimonadales bacterium]|nr:multidrug efflux RND transporter permease subunit [Gemmatimonadales bacterium]
MNISRFFIDRPIFATVLSIVITIAGLLAMQILPISEYPEVVPPTVQVRAIFPGASPETISETVATPLEEQINGVEDMLYMSSSATTDGVMQLTVTFALGTDIDIAQVQVQNRVNQALPRLPEEVRRLGVTTVKSSPDLTMVVHLTSPNRRYDALYLRNYALINIRDVLARLPDMGNVRIFGGGDYAMRIWLDPAKVAARNLTAAEVVQAVQQQNVQVSAGILGGPPVAQQVPFQLTINTRGRLLDEEEFGDVVIRTGAEGQLTRLRDVARVELAAQDYALRSGLDNQAAIPIAVFLLPGGNSLRLSERVRATMEELSQNFPEGISYQIVYDPTVFVRESIREVVKTLFEAVLLVVIVVVLFLQTWRASVIPLIAVPVSIVGTFTVMLGFGFSINTLTLFGLVLAIGIVVDDAIVVVENVERNIEQGLQPKEAAYRAMEEVTGPIIAIALVLCAVFVPVALVPGFTGQFYRQFALTIAFSTVISAFNSLTLSPALAAILLQPHGARRDLLTRLLDRSLGWIFRPFNRGFSAGSERYRGGVERLATRPGWPLAVYAGLLALTVLVFRTVPEGFIPPQDKQYLVGVAQLPDASSLDRTDSVLRKMTAIALKHPAVSHGVQFTGLSVNGFVNASNQGIVFFPLKPFEERQEPELRGQAVAQALNARFASIQEAFVAVFPPPAIQGLGSTGGFKMQVQDRGALGEEQLFQATEAVIAKANQQPQLRGVFSTFRMNVPQVWVDIDRERARRQDVAMPELFATLGVYLGSAYVNDFNRFGRTYQVVAQADAPFRSHVEDIGNLRVRNASGEMVPLGALVRTRETFGPDRVGRYNAFLTADINGSLAPGVSSGQGVALMERLARETLPRGMGFEWTELTFQQVQEGATLLLVFPLSILLAFLVLAAQYESWSLPLVVILIVPLSVLAAMGGVWLAKGDNNIFTQVGLVVLAALACKNAILIVEFARELELQGRSILGAALEACRLRLRPILMTSFAFIGGVTPLVISTGAGSEIRRALGIAVWAGMLGVTIFGLFLTPVLYVVIRSLVTRRAPTTIPT